MTALILATLVAGADSRPNFILMMTDDQAHQKLSFMGDALLKTPNLDKLAATGMRFENAFVINALCAPSRATFLSGQYSHAHGVIDNRNRPLPTDKPYLPELLRSAGYDVGFCGKSHVQGALRNREWDHYFGFRGQGRYVDPVIAEGVNGKDVPHVGGYMDDVVTDNALEWLRKRDKSKPFCLFLWFKAPHRSWARAERHK
ncbi:MAG TPA: sulfatase-like hydrolase/transferase, partial [Planctomycetia bacterium]|nr:sulfatase-like hydrolase/transferase [Planctomycetia bacterium]